ncbi:MAG: hypothetical protein ACRDJH_03330 [Thermomicrobiales bacterium]
MRAIVLSGDRHATAAAWTGSLCRWLHDHKPATGECAVLIHGDCRGIDTLGGDRGGRGDG